MLSFCQAGHDYAASPVTECPESSKSRFRVHLSHCLPFHVVDAYARRDLGEGMRAAAEFTTSKRSASSSHAAHMRRQE